MMQRWKLILGAVLVLAMTGAAIACPSCKDTISSTDTAGAPGVAGAFNSSIYVMLGGLFAAIGLVARVIIKGIRGS